MTEREDNVTDLDLFDSIREDSFPKPSTMREPPSGDHQADFFAPQLFDVSTRDSRSIMDVAVFRLSKRVRRRGEVIRYEVPDGVVEVSCGPAGMASIWDYDLVIMVISHLTEAMNRYRRGTGPKPGRTFRLHYNDILKFCRRNTGGQQKKNLSDTLHRLNTTHVRVWREKRDHIIEGGDNLIASYTLIENKRTGKTEGAEIEIPKWLYDEVARGNNPDVLTVHPDYFLIEPGIGRFLYRLARRAAGKTEAKYSFQKIYDRSGSAGSLKKFTFTLRKIIKENQLPEYELLESPGSMGPVLIMMHRAYSAELHGVTPQEYTAQLIKNGMEPSSATEEGYKYAKKLRKSREKNQEPGS